MSGVLNLLASIGLCDILLPSLHDDDLVRGLRRRLGQAMQRLFNYDCKARIVLLLDGIDHAAIQAEETHSKSFAHVLLQSLSVNPIPGIALVASCRTERIKHACGNVDCDFLQIPGFSLAETAAVVKQHESKATYSEVAALYGRSGGNPRILDALLNMGRPYDWPIPNDGSADLLDSLLENRINEARNEALKRGVGEAEIRALLASLALLPPPVPLSELAAAQELADAAIESFAADLLPLLDRTPHGLIFRDEPTETLIRHLFRTDMRSCEAVVKRLKGRQMNSAYAARALPIVLTSLGLTDDLIDLAFNDQMPRGMSRVAHRMIRLSRLTAALVACASENRTDDLVKLLVEASRVAGGNERSDWFLQHHPDLVALSGDAEALRRLFETKTGWPGARHAALAIAYAFRDDAGEARRNCHRAFGWLNWRSKLSEDERRAKFAQEDGDQDYFGPAYVEALSGNATRVACWIDRWPEYHSFRVFSKIVCLLENHSITSANLPKGRLISKASRCRLNSRALPAAVLYHANLDPDQERRLIVRIAKISRNSGPMKEGWPHLEQNSDFKGTLLSVAVKAAGLGLYAEAGDIVDAIGLERPRFHDFESPWIEKNDIERCVLSAAVKAAREGREPSLADLIPLELADAIPVRKRKGESELIESAIERLLNDTVSRTSRKRNKRKLAFDYRMRQQAKDILTHRVKPLIPFANAVAAMIKSGDRDFALKRAIDEMERTTAGAQNYPFRDGARYISRTAFSILFAAGDALGAISKENAKRLVDWLMRSPLKQTAMLIHIVERLSYRSTTCESALALARDVDSLIGTETDIDSRIASYGSLARAIWRTSPIEAKAYFRRGLDVSDEMGSEDYERAAGLIEFASHYTGPKLTPQTINDFVRICEMNAQDRSDKFGWVGFTLALARIGGTGTLAIISRLADRKCASMSWTLAPLLSNLVKYGHLNAQMAAALIGLDEPTETWSWKIADFVAIVFPFLNSSQREAVLTFVLTEIDREYLGSPPQKMVEALLETARVYLEPISPSLTRLIQIVDQNQNEEIESDFALRRSFSAAPEDKEEVKEIAIPNINPSDASAIDTVFLEEKKDRPEDRQAIRVFIKIGDRLQQLDDRYGFLKAICEAQVPSLEDKLLIMGKLIPTWRRQSLAIINAVPELFQQLAIRHSSELTGSDWDSSYNLKQLADLSGRKSADFIPSIIAALHDAAIEVNGATWQTFASMLAPKASPESIRSALVRSVSISAGNLPDNIGDGPWRPVLDSIGADKEIVAGLIWFCLGSPDIRLRWRAAHAIRRLVDLGCAEVITTLVKYIDKQDAGPFQDQKLPFMFLHAKLWLLIALGRIALDNPTVILPFRPILESIAFGDDFPHAVMQHFSAMALTNVESSIKSDDTSLKTKLLKVNVSRFAPIKARHPRSDFHSSRWSGESTSGNPFYFDYEFGEHQIDYLARVFGCDYEKVADSCTRWIRQWSADIKNMWDCPRSPGRSYETFNTWSNGRLPQIDTWGGQLAWHALMLTAGELLRKKPFQQEYINENPWYEWLSNNSLSRIDGLWLADGTDYFPPELPRLESSTWIMNHLCKDPKKLAEFAAIKNLTISDKLVVDGTWTLAGNVDLFVRSVLSDEAVAETLAFAVATEEPFHRWLPRESDLIHWNLKKCNIEFFQPFTTCEQTDCKFDLDDPYGAASALYRPKPVAAIIEAAGVRAADPFARFWTEELVSIGFHAEAWGGNRGEGRDTKEMTGTRLLCMTELLQTVLSKLKKQLVILIKAQKYLDAHHKRTPRKNKKMGLGSFQVTTLIAIVSPNKGLRVVRRIPKIVRLAIANLSLQERDDFITRLNAIHATLSHK